MATVGAVFQNSQVLAEACHITSLK